MSTQKAVIGVIGLGVMGANLARNAVSRGNIVAVYNRTTEKTDEFMKAHRHEGSFVASHSLKDFVASLAKPRSILLMVKAGDAVDAVIQELLPLLDKEDIVIDAGNSLFSDTDRREAELAAKGIRFVGLGVSGGEEGALKGPSMMPGGEPRSVAHLLKTFKSMAADDGNGGKCVSYMGPGGAGHFVKMVHNGIEYAIMQAIAESYDVLKTAGKCTNPELHKVYRGWSTKGDLRGFLLEITADIFSKKDPLTGKYMIDVIADAAGQKGTGKWTTECAMTIGAAVPSINASVDARILSGEIELRARRSKEVPEALLNAKISKMKLVKEMKDALSLTVLTCYAQGFELMAKMSREKNWNINLAEVARIWRGGCIIRSAFLPELEAAHLPGAKGKTATKKLFKRYAGSAQKNWRTVIAAAVSKGVPVPVMSSALSFYDSVRKPRLPQNLIQAQRDYFGAHTYKRVDKPGIFHSDWSSL